MSFAAAVLRLLLRCGRAMPLETAWRVGGALGDLFGRLPLRDQGRARAHLARAFPDRDATWVRRTARRAFRHAGATALWTIAAYHRDPVALRRGIVVEGADHLRAAIRAHRRGEATVAFSGHFGNWELLARVGGTVLPVTVIGRRLRDPSVDDLVVAMRRGCGNGIIYQEDGVRPCLRALRAGRYLATLPDQDVPRLAGVFVPWFGIPAWTPCGPAQLAVLGRAPWMPAFLYRRAGRWVSHWGPRLEAPAGDRDTAAYAITALAMAYEERLVRRHPEQWVWWHKRWRTRPPAAGACGDGSRATGDGSGTGPGT